MWIFLGILIVLALVALVVFLALVVGNKDRSDYQDGGGQLYGGIEKISFFSPFNDRAGILGEDYVNSELRLLLRKDEYLLANVLLPSGISMSLCSAPDV